MTAATLTLTDFLLARIAEDDANGWMASGLRAEPYSLTRPHLECEAKRRIVGDHEWDEVSGRTRVLRFLALPYAEHPDYREEWKP